MLSSERPGLSLTHDACLTEDSVSIGLNHKVDIGVVFRRSGHDKTDYKALAPKFLTSVIRTRLARPCVDLRARPNYWVFSGPPKDDQALRPPHLPFS